MKIFLVDWRAALLAVASPFLFAGCPSAPETLESDRQQASADVTSRVIVCTPGSNSSDADSDGDGLPDSYERKIGTAPNRADTDYDGYSDCEEVIDKGWDPQNNNFYFNPFIADLPILGVEITGGPVIEIVYTEGSVENITIGTERSTSQAQSISSARGGSNSTAAESTFTSGASRADSSTIRAEISATAEVEAGLVPSVSASLTASIGSELTSSLTSSYEYSDTNTSESTISWNRETAEEKSRALSQMQQRQKEQSIAASEGLIRVSAFIVNTGKIAATISGITLSAYSLDPVNRSNRPLPTLVSPSEPFTLAPGQKYGPLVFEARLTIAETEQLLADSSGLVVSAPGLEMLDAEGRPFVHNMTNIPTQTARVIIDYGLPLRGGQGLQAEDYRVALTDEEGVIGADRLLRDILKIEAKTGEPKWTYGPEEKRTVGPGIISVRGIEMRDAEDTFWTVSHTRKIANGFTEVTENFSILDPGGYRFGDLKIRRGDVLHLLLVKDADRDGLGERAEALYGTSPFLADSDGDGWNDRDEIIGWQYEVIVGGRKRYKQLTTNPLIANGHPTRQYPRDEELATPLDWESLPFTTVHDRPVVLYPRCGFEGQPIELPIGKSDGGVLKTLINGTIGSIEVADGYRFSIVPVRARKDGRLKPYVKDELCLKAPAIPLAGLACLVVDKVDEPWPPVKEEQIRGDFYLYDCNNQVQ